MKWTSKLPSKPGFYWYRYPVKPVQVRVLEVMRPFWSTGGLFVWDWKDGRLAQWSIEQHYQGGAWYGPLKEPK